jgi:hypothetical protein
MIWMRTTRLLILLLSVAGCASSVGLPDRPAVHAEFVGTTLGDARVRKFMGGLDDSAPCHCVTWRLTLFAGHPSHLPAKYTLVATYGLPGRDDPNQLVDGPTVRVEGTWKIINDYPANPSTGVYHLHGPDRQSLRLVRLSEHLLHLLDPAGRLMVGDGGWSYTLNRKGLGYEN